MISQFNHHSPLMQMVLDDMRQLDIDNYDAETDNLKEWLSTPERRGMLNIRGIERTCDLPFGTLKQWLRGSQGLPQHHLDNLVRMLSLLGYQAVTNNHQFL